MADAQSIPILDLSLAGDPSTKPLLLARLYDALFNVGFLYIQNHTIPDAKIEALTSRIPSLFDIPDDEKARLSKKNSPHFLGYSWFAEEVTLGRHDLREQFDFATELPVVWDPNSTPEKHSRRDFSRLYWRLRGPNQWPNEALLPGFRSALTEFVCRLLVFRDTSRLTLSTKGIMTPCKNSHINLSTWSKKLSVFPSAPSISSSPFRLSAITELNPAIASRALARATCRRSTGSNL